MRLEKFDIYFAVSLKNNIGGPQSTSQYHHKLLGIVHYSDT